MPATNSQAGSGCGVRQFAAADGALRVELSGAWNLRALIAQRTFAAERPAAPDAAGAVKALSEASDDMIERLLDWAMTHLKHQPSSQNSETGRRSDK